MRTVIQVSVRNVYGLEKIYPENEAALALASIAGTKTLSLRALRDAQEGLGCAIVLVSGDVGSVANAVRSLQNDLADLVKVDG